MVAALGLGLSIGLSTMLSIGLSGDPSEALGFGLFYGLIAGLSVALTILFGVGFGCWSELPLKNGVMSGIAGLIGWLCLALISDFKYLGSAHSLTYPSMFGLTFGLIFGLIGAFGGGSLKHITLVETMSWNWN